MVPEQREVDLFISGAGELATPRGAAARGGADLGAILVLEGGAMAVDGGRIVAVGPEAELRGSWRGRRELCAAGGTLIPGFVDAHTHPVFAGTREEEFESRVAGASYLEIAAAGGGIASSVKGVRGASAEELLVALLLRLDRFLELGTTTVEAKTGYGLSPEDEMKCLEVIAAADAAHAVDLVPTFLGAHDFPLEYRDSQADRERYVDLLVEEMIPAVAASGLARYCDIFTEAHVFDLDQTRRILGRARDLGLGLRLHVDQLTPLGGAELAAELGAASADHLEHISADGISALGEAGVVPVLCPLVPLYLGQDQEAPGRALVNAGLAPALATDFNPGSCYTQSMGEVLTWSALRFGFSAAEALTAATLNAACSLDLSKRVGSLEVGKVADVLVLDLPGHRHLTYEFGRNPVRAVVKAGELVHER
ncbi:MAG: imidazolonepropionase [Planctomycetes bacterium]|jgi:imidazolonepropionase|nr:imidazolonepropionase [Planctomycetota bacterium]HJO27016.1 imidazolonepropionase [Planctomycetota bacterium]